MEKGKIKLKKLDKKLDTEEKTCKINTAGHNYSKERVNYNYAA